MAFFTEAFEAMSAEERESFYKTVFMNDPSSYAKQKREEYYRSVLRHMGEDVSIGTGVKIVNPHLISIGNGVRISDGVTIIARKGSEITIAPRAQLEERVYLDTEKAGGYIHIGERVYIGTGTTLFGHKGLEIGDFSLLAQNITLTPYSHRYADPERSIREQGGIDKKVVIGRDCYIGLGVCIVYSGDIGDGSIVGAGSVVVKPIPPYSVAVGCPAKVIKMREKGSDKEQL